MKRTIGAIILTVAFAVCGCEIYPEDIDGNNNNTNNNNTGGTTGPAKVTCYDTVDIELIKGLGDEEKNPVFVRATLPSDTYGANNFMLWEVVNTGDEENPEYRYADTGDLVERKVLEEGYEIPEGRIWSAGRPMNLDGYDPYKFNESDPFWYGYVPFTYTRPWKSYNDVENNGECPDIEGFDSLGRPNCLDINELDSRTPQLENGKTYLARMFFGAKLNINNIGNWIMTCNQAIFTYNKDEAVDFDELNSADAANASSADEYNFDGEENLTNKELSNLIKKENVIYDNNLLGTKSIGILR